MKGNAPKRKVFQDALDILTEDPELWNIKSGNCADMLPSEKAEVLVARYEKIRCWGRRNDIMHEIEMLE